MHDYFKADMMIETIVDPIVRVDSGSFDFQRIYICVFKGTIQLLLQLKEMAQENAPENAAEPRR